MPRLMTSRPWAASALARASTANAFSSPIRSNAAIVLSIANSSLVCSDSAGVQTQSSTTISFLAELQFRHAQHFKDYRDRPTDQQQAIERSDRPGETPCCTRHG